jgi:hypothetical protein
MDLSESGWGGTDWIHLAQWGGALVNTVMNFRVPYSVGKFLSN